MKSTIRLFKAVPIDSKRKKKLSKEILSKTIPKGFVFSPEVNYNYSEKELLKLISVVEQEYGLTAEQMNSSFHKSWQKIRKASMEQLVMEQLVHYITTYGFESLGVYSEDSVFIPKEKLEIPSIEEGISLVVIKGYTHEELKEKLMHLLQSGVALKEDTIKDVLEVCKLVKLTIKEVDSIRNREVKTALYLDLELVPENPVEFLRLVALLSTGKTMLIKNKTTIGTIKSSNVNVNSLFVKYKKEYGLENLASIFLRFKPLFLAFKANSQMKAVINKIRKLAEKHHKPLQQDYFNTLTANISKGDIDKEEFTKKLKELNTFRKIRVAYALKYRTRDVESILFRIRNGKGYAKEFSFKKSKQPLAKELFGLLVDSIVSDLKKNVKGKKIFIPSNIVYALPATEKQFTGDFPSGTYVNIPKDMVVGVQWNNVKSNRIDLDLSMVNVDSKIGWDTSYRSENADVLFSGDMTDASQGATELFYIKRQAAGTYILMLNYYNYSEAIEVPLKILVASEQVKNMSHNYMVNPNNVACISKTTINKKQKVLGLISVNTNGNKFYFAEAYLGNDITSRGSPFVQHSRQYLMDYYSNTISLNELLEKAGAKLVEKKSDAEIDLSPETLEKDKILNLIISK